MFIFISFYAFATNLFIHAFSAFLGVTESGMRPAMRPPVDRYVLLCRDKVLLDLQYILPVWFPKVGVAVSIPVSNAMFLLFVFLSVLPHPWMSFSLFFLGFKHFQPVSGIFLWC